MTTDLKPCPFCGGEATFLEPRYIMCENLASGCGLAVQRQMFSVEEWNTRADLPRPEDAARIAELEAALEPFAFFDQHTSTQEAWDIMHRDRVKDWIDYDDIARARAALNEKDPPPPEE